MKKMELEKANTQPPVVNGEGCQRKSTQPIDHWAFLEEFEAPMWADLTLESTFMDKDIDDGWFHVAHPFHQASSCQLMSTSSVFGEGKPNSESDLLGKSPCKLPPSVSGSRGKHYKSRKWRRGNVDKQHPISILSRKTVRVTSVKPNLKTSSGNPKCTFGSKGRLVTESSRDTRKPASIQRKTSIQNSKSTSSSKPTENSESTSTYSMKPASTKTKRSFGDSGSTSKLSANFEGKSNSTTISGADVLKHTVTLGDSNFTCTMRPNSLKVKPSFGDSDKTVGENASSLCNSSASSDMPDSARYMSSFVFPKISTVSMGNEGNSQVSQITAEVSHQIFGQASGILSAVRLSLRKSSVTRRPSRVEVKDNRQSKGRKSSLSKSSVGSNSSSGGNLTVFTATMKKSITPESKAVVKIDQPTTDNNVEGKYVSTTTTARLLDLKPIVKREGGTNTLRSISQEISKPKVVNHYERRKPLLLQNVQNLSTGATKAKGSLSNSYKVNAFGCNFSHKKPGGKENNTRCMEWTEKASIDTLKLKEEKALSSPKVKAIARNKRTNMKNVAPRTYFR